MKEMDEVREAESVEERLTEIMSVSLMSICSEGNLKQVFTADKIGLIHREVL